MVEFETDEWKLEINLNNFRLILLENLRKRDCNALVARGGLKFVSTSVTNLNHFNSQKILDLIDYHVYFCKGNTIATAKKGKLVNPTNFSFYSKYDKQLLNEYFFKSFTVCLLWGVKWGFFFLFRFFFLFFFLIIFLGWFEFGLKKSVIFNFN